MTEIPKPKRKRRVPATAPSAPLPTYPPVGFYTPADGYPTHVEAHEAEYRRIAYVLGVAVHDTGRRHDWGRSPIGILVIDEVSHVVDAKLRAAGYDPGPA